MTSLGTLYSSVFLALISAGVLAVIIHCLRNHSNAKRSRLRLAVMEANNRMLHAQLNPHFLYNLLNVSGGSIARNDHRSALETISKFSELMRVLFKHSLEDFVQLNEELNAVRLYVELERKRWDHALDYQIILTKNTLGNCLIPPLMLQPLMEDALWNGLSQKKAAWRSEVEIQQSGDSLVLKIRHNGTMRLHLTVEEETNSMDILEERVKLLKKTLGKPASLTFTRNLDSEWPSITTLTLPVIHERSL